MPAVRGSAYITQLTEPLVSQPRRQLVAGFGGAAVVGPTSRHAALGQGQCSEQGHISSGGQMLHSFIRHLWRVSWSGDNTIIRGAGGEGLFCTRNELGVIFSVAFSKILTLIKINARKDVGTSIGI